MARVQRQHPVLHARLRDQNVRPEFDAFPWKDPDSKQLEAWQTGQTGVPLVDAGMRELWHTGVMHNRVRMVAASFLVKNLLVDWRIGEAWFWDTLVDADEASNPGNWQWVAGSGVDAAPYFRVFNPETQAKKFDPEAHYIQRWVPEFEGKLRASVPPRPRRCLVRRTPRRLSICAKRAYPRLPLTTRCGPLGWASPSASEDGSPRKPQRLPPTFCSGCNRSVL
ncbi:FAD-binding domain-containing protein [Leucobacter coleopterorum]|uniref:FAD-binding domain-containing protein n=1 Tax=Leucobacter coleopterorum TaxID=2714933 RepID=UPI003137E947